VAALAAWAIAGAGRQKTSADVDAINSRATPAIRPGMLPTTHH